MREIPERLDMKNTDWTYQSFPNRGGRVEARSKWLPDVERLRKLAEMIEAHPEHFDMDEWIGVAKERDGRTVIDMCILGAEVCDTTACAAGWAISQWPADIPDFAREQDDPEVAGAMILGLPVVAVYHNGVFEHAMEDTGLFYSGGDATTMAMKLRAIADEADRVG